VRGLGLAFVQSIENGGQFAHRANEPIPEQAKSQRQFSLLAAHRSSADDSELAFDYNPFPKIDQSIEAASCDLGD
jgi:hypothetical protein